MSVKVVFQDLGHAYSKETPIRTFYEGLFSDIKPTDCKEGSEFRELDTMNLWGFDGSSWWIKESGLDRKSPIFDVSGRSSFNSIFGDKYVSMRKPKFSMNFCYSVDTRDTVKSEVNGGTIGSVANLLTIQTGVNIAGSASLQTKESLRYSAGRDAETMFTALFTTGVINSLQRVGLFDSVTGVFIGYENDKFGISVRKDGTTTFIEQVNFLNDKLDGSGASGYTIDKTKLNIFRICYGYLGVAPIYFSIFAGYDKGWIDFHIYDISGKSIGTHISNPYLPFRGEVINSGNNTNIKLQMGSLYAGVIDGSGAPDSSSREFSAKILKPVAVAGTDLVLGIFHNKTTFFSIANKIEALLLKVGVSVDGTKNVTVSLYKTSTAPTGASYTQVDITNSTLEYSTTGVISLAGAQFLDSFELGKVDSREFKVSEYGYLLLPNEYAFFTYTTTNTTDLSMSIRWSELF